MAEIENSDCLLGGGMEGGRMNLLAGPAHRPIPAVTHEESLHLDRAWETIEEHVTAYKEQVLATSGAQLGVSTWETRHRA